MAEGKLTVPDMLPVLPTPGQKPLVVIGNEDEEFAVSVVAALLHVLFGTLTSVALIVQIAGGPPIVMTALPVTSTAVVLVAVAIHGPVVCTTVGESPRLLVQPLNVGPAAVPAEFVVVATAPVALTKVLIVHVTVDPAVSVRAAECPGTTVPCGVQVTADADDARASVAKATRPMNLKLRMPNSLSD